MRSHVAFLCIFLTIVAFCTSAVSARRTFKCERVWPGPSEDNDPTECLGNITHMQELYVSQEDLRIAWLVYVVLPLLILVLTCCTCPCATAARYFCRCCGGYRRRPDGTPMPVEERKQILKENDGEMPGPQESHCCCGGADWDLATDSEKEIAYPRSSIRNTKGCAIVICMMGVCAAIVLMLGSAELLAGYDGIFNAALEITNWVRGKAGDIRQTMTVNNTLVPGLNESFFTDLDNTISDFQKDVTQVKTDNQPYIDISNIVSLCFATVPLLSLIATVICAVCDIRTFCLFCNNCCHCIFVFFFGLLGFIFLLFGVLLTDLCGERDAFLAREPGIGKWWIEPTCNSTLPFEQFQADIAAAVVTNSRAACDSLLGICSQQELWTEGGVDDAKFYYCNGLSNSTSQCQTLASVVNWTDRIRVRTSAPLNCTSGRTCTVQECAVSCNDTSAKTGASDAVTNLNFASVSYDAFTLHISPLMNCETVLDQIFLPLSVCDTFLDAFILLGSGSFIYTFLFAVGICVIFRGQKRFFKPPHETDSEGEEEMEDTMDATLTKAEDIQYTVGEKMYIRIKKKNNEPIE